MMFPALFAMRYSTLCLLSWLAELLRISVMEQAAEHSHQWVKNQSLNLYGKRRVTSVAIMRQEFTLFQLEKV